MKISILDYWPKGAKPPEPEQRELLLQYAALPDAVQVVGVLAPTAFGKTYVLATIGAYENAHHGGGATYLTPTNDLVKQTNDDLAPEGWCVAPYRNAPHPKPWEVVKKEWLDTPLKLCNPMSYLANRGYSRCLMIDEGHTIRGVLQDFEGMTIWHHLNPWPLNIRTIDQLLFWLASEPDDEPTLRKLRKLLKKDPSSYILEQGTAEYRWKEQTYLRVVPLTPKNNRPVFWPPSRVKRIVLASATLSREDLADIGLDRRYTAWLTAKSRIPAERRPLIYAPCAYPVYGRTEEIPKLADGILDLASYHSGERGLIHCTYGLAAQLRPYLSHDKRFIFYSDKDSKRGAFNKWQASPDGVLMACGMHEGVNLKYDMARWQGIAKAVWPSQADEATRLKKEQRPDWYLWETLKIMMQSYGRVCRMPDDYGVTYILTAEFRRLYTEALAKGLVPTWFSEALQGL